MNQARWPVCHVPIHEQLAQNPQTTILCAPFVAWWNIVSRLAAALASCSALRFNKTVGMVASSARPQVFLLYSRKMYPFSPHPDAHELRTIQYGVGAVVLNPVAWTQ